MRNKSYYPWICIQGDLLPESASCLDMISSWNGASRIKEEDRDFLWRFVVCMDFPRSASSEYMIGFCNRMIAFIDSCDVSDISILMYNTTLLRGLSARELININRDCFLAIIRICANCCEESVHWVGDSTNPYDNSEVWNYWREKLNLSRP